MTAHLYGRRGVLAASLAGMAGLGLAACGGSGFSESGASDAGSGGSGKLSVLIGSSGDAETKAVKDAVAAFSKESGIEAEVIAASDLGQQLSQGFASGSPADVFYLSTDAMAGFAKNGSLEAYGDKLSTKDSFYPALVEAFTLDGAFYGAPKDFSTLALIINAKKWKDAGLTEADIPADWQALHDVAKKLTAGDTVGFCTSAEYQRLGAFMAGAGGELVTDGKATADAKQNVEALQFVQSMLKDGSMKFAADLGAGWGGEAFGTQKAAMVLEGNWVTGALANDYPDLEYIVAEVPAGPAGRGTLQFTNAWGMAADSKNKDAALKLIEFLTTPEQQMAFAKAFGVMPSLTEVADQWTKEYPKQAAFIAAAEYAKNPPAQADTAEVVADFNAQIEGLASGDPAAILSSVQSSLEAALGA